MISDSCPRDEAGFCRIAMAGHRLCRRDDCRVTDPEKAWDEVLQSLIAKLSAKNRRQQGRRAP